MFKIIGVFFLVLAFIALLVFMLFASAILSVVRKLRKMLRDEADKQDDYTGRRQQQYTYRGGAAERQTADAQQRTDTNNATDKETIIDTRSPRQSNNRIFEDNEGEYVDFVEEN